jgi:hypothetical protein
MSVSVDQGESRTLQKRENGPCSRN